MIIEKEGDLKMSKRVIGLDIESYDPLLKTSSYSQKSSKAMTLF